MRLISVLKEITAFLKARKKWWLAPVFVTLAVLGLIMVFAAGSPLAPFIYTLF